MLELELNTSGTLTFTIAPEHYYYNSIQKRKSVIKVFQDDELIFFGSPLDETSDDNTVKTITVDGALSWLNDTVQPYKMYNDIDVSGFLQALLTIHNSGVSSFKQFYLGSVTVTDSNDNLYRYTNYEKTKDTISDDLIDSLGGYVKARQSNGINYIDYLVSSGGVNEQGVHFGFNLISCIKELKSSTTATAIIPLGAKISEDSDERLTIADVNDNIIYIYDEDSVEEFDWIYDTVIFDDVTVADNLKSKAYEELAKRKYLSGTYTINAIDMSLMDGIYESIRLGNYIPIVSEKHGVNDYMTVSAMSIDICEPTQSTLTIGSEFTTLTDSKRYADKVVDLIYKDYVTNETLTNTVSKTVAESTVEYYVSTSADELIDGEWSSSSPVWLRVHTFS
ncbi:MAG: phage tail protein, partial [Clostridia bacterium]